jgi:hypothetical protein
VDFHWWEIVAIISATSLAWGTVTFRVVRNQIDSRIDKKLSEVVITAVNLAVRNGVTERMDRIEMKLDRLTALHLKGEHE